MVGIGPGIGLDFGGRMLDVGLTATFTGTGVELLPGFGFTGLLEF